MDLHAPESAERQDCGDGGVLVALQEGLFGWRVVHAFLAIRLQQRPLDRRGRHDRRGASFEHAPEIQIRPIPRPLPHCEHVDPGERGVVWWCGGVGMAIWCGRT